ncbi:hypothetical protein EHO58_05445 [Leptospira selangorensis]|uniref:hypothetical protein n=1 Tax=Leptospira selangorensis TaxID=2484982 RepID=UPI0010831B35|nr:hypothetical protein [Leptospira selangorensis]TGK09813.1 hypothetical protein EHO58_05445 [Leptospira selangorensis]
MKRDIRILILAFSVLLFRCSGDSSPAGCEACLIAPLEPINAKIQILNRSDLGNVTFYIQDRIFQINASDLTLQYGINTKKKGGYQLVADVGGELFNFSNFDFSGTINDGSFITTPRIIEEDKCNLFDGPSGTIIPDGCL